MQLEAMSPATDARRSDSGHSAERAVRENKEIKQESLLAQRHIVGLLFMEAVYTVSHAAVERGCTFARGVSECRRMLLLVRNGCTNTNNRLRPEEPSSVPWVLYNK